MKDEWHHRDDENVRIAKLKRAPRPRAEVPLQLNRYSFAIRWIWTCLKKNDAHGGLQFCSLFWPINTDELLLLHPSSVL